LGLTNTNLRNHIDIDLAPLRASFAAVTEIDEWGYADMLS